MQPIDADESKYVKLKDVLFVLNALHERSNTTARFAYSNAYNHMKNLDGEDVVPVKHAHWIDAVFTPYDSEDRQKAIQDYCNHGGNVADWQTYTQYCSNCLADFDVFDNDFIISADYCPHCGATMKEEVPE